MYDASHTPPKDAWHVVQFIFMFRSGGTACNYVTHVATACKSFHLSVAWYDEFVLQARRAAKARTLITFGDISLNKPITFFRGLTDYMFN